MITEGAVPEAPGAAAPVPAQATEGGQVAAAEPVAEGAAVAPPTSAAPTLAQATRAALERDRKAARRDAELRQRESQLASREAQIGELKAQLERLTAMTARAKTDPTVLAELGVDPNLALAYGMGERPEVNPLDEVRGLAKQALELAERADAALGEERKKWEERDQTETHSKKQLAARSLITDQHEALRYKLQREGTAVLDGIIAQIEFEASEYGEVDPADVLRRMDDYYGDKLAEELQGVLQVNRVRSRLMPQAAPAAPTPAQPPVSIPSGLTGLRAEASEAGRPLSMQEQQRRAFDRYFAQVKEPRGA